jgi:hypothetical protein
MWMFVCTSLRDDSSFGKNGDQTMTPVIAH